MFSCMFIVAVHICYANKHRVAHCMRRRCFCFLRSFMQNNCGIINMELDTVMAYV